MKQRQKDTAYLQKRMFSIKILEKYCQDSPEPLGQILKHSSLLEIKELTILARFICEKKCGQKLLRRNKSPLHWAAMRGILESFKKIFNNALYKNPKDYYGFTPLHYAAGHAGFFDICEFIINNVEEKNPKNKLGNTPLHFAAKNGHLDITKLIIEKIESIENRNPKNFYLETPLHSAAENGHLSVYQFLIRNVEDKNPKNKDGLTPLSYAAMKNNHSFERFFNEYQEEAKAWACWDKHRGEKKRMNK